MASDSDPVFRHSAAHWTGAYESLRDALVKKLVEARDRGAGPQELLDLAESAIDGQKDLLARLLTDARVAGFIAGAGAVLDNPAAPPSEPSMYADNEDWRYSGKFMPVVKAAVKSLRDRRIMTREDFEDLEEEAADRAAFYVDRLAEADAERVARAIEVAVEEGTSLSTFKAAMRGILHERGDRIETTFRNGVHGAYLRGMEHTLADPVIEDLFKYVQNHSIDDSRETELCHTINKSGIDGTNIFRIDDPVWQHFRPLRHHGCRCSFTPLTVSQAASYLRSAQQWEETGIEPRDFVPWPRVSLPAGWKPGGDL